MAESKLKLVLSRSEVQPSKVIQTWGYNWDAKPRFPHHLHHHHHHYCCSYHSDFSPYAKHRLSILCAQILTSAPWGRAPYDSIVQKEKPSHREVKSLPQDHTHSKWQNQDLNPKLAKTGGHGLTHGDPSLLLWALDLLTMHIPWHRGNRLMHEYMNKRGHFQGYHPLTPVTRDNKREGGLCLSLSSRAASFKGSKWGRAAGKSLGNAHYKSIILWLSPWRGASAGQCSRVQTLSWLDREEQGTLEVGHHPLPAERSPHAMLMRTCQWLLSPPRRGWFPFYQWSCTELGGNKPPRQHMACPSGLPISHCIARALWEKSTVRKTRDQEAF